MAADAVPPTHAARTAAGAPTRRGTWTLWSLRVTVTAHAVAIVAQGLTAGGLLEGGSYGSLHGPGAGPVHVAALAQLVAAVLLWLVARGPWWPAALSLVLLVAGVVQSALGGGGSVAAHVPLGVTLIALTAGLAAWSYSWRPAAR